MSSSSNTPSPTSSKPRLLVKIKLASESLKQFVESPPASVLNTPSKPASIADEEKTPLGATSPATAASPAPTPSVASPAPTGPGSPPTLEGKAVNGVVEAVKRGGKRASGGGGKPGPKKRKLDDGSSLPPSRLGPKSSGGAINAGLRALDRSGAPCRKWAKSPVILKSFTGFKFTVKAYGTNVTPAPPVVEEPKETVNVNMSDAASLVSGQSEAGTPKEDVTDTNGVTPMEDVRSTNGDSNTPLGAAAGINGVSGAGEPTKPNGVHVSTPGGTLVPPV
ncbi:hypothetical protein TWF788_010364 [Orbilia oligospora]|uniref:Uncharacterized protein n=1 Tax=Orbilia oligospora TaxID=2813651 RepID=A0A7C8PEE2_ORBOL|nr:hypothetical protein TWF788_010364 [Orbilia oligospora]KAF3197736.1 hypothetical protein TWF679_002786 [Orbilia oligospora]